MSFVLLLQNLSVCRLNYYLFQSPFWLVFQVPALIRLNSNEPSIVVENKSNILTLIRPRAGVGVCKLNSSQLSSLCSDSDSIPVLIFRKTDLTPEKSLVYRGFTITA